MAADSALETLAVRAARSRAVGRAKAPLAGRGARQPSVDSDADGGSDAAAADPFVPLAAALAAPESVVAWSCAVSADAVRRVVP